MTVGEIKNTVMFQTNNDSDDLEDFLPYLMDYINDGYDRLVYAYTKKHASPMLHADTETPDLPEWAHPALADWSTWLVYRNGNPQKQQRGYAFRSSFEEIRTKLVENSADGSRVEHFINLPR